MDHVYNAGNRAFIECRRSDTGIRWYDRPNDRLLKLFTDIHHPTEAAKYVRDERPVQLVNPKQFLHDPGAEIRIRRDSQPAAPARLFKTFDECELIHPLHDLCAFLLVPGYFDLPRIDRPEQRRQVDLGTWIELDM